MTNNPVSRSWFGVLPNPKNHGYTGTPEETCEQLRDEWIASHPNGTGAWAYCISGAGLVHIHMVLEDTSAMRFSEIKKTYAPGMHIEETKGSKRQAEDYINKRPPYDESGETVVCIVRHGEICGRQGKRSDLEEYHDMIEAGMSPREIYSVDPSARRYERFLNDDFWQQRSKNVPALRPMNNNYIFGPAHSGKTYTYVTLCESVGEENIYFMTDFTNNGSAGLDKYMGQKILFMDEPRDGLHYSTLLQMLQGYRGQYHARYSNGPMLWEVTYIASIYAPEELYARLVPAGTRDVSSFEQLLWRLDTITYCFRDADGKYRRYTIDARDYRGRDNLIAEATAAFAQSSDDR